MALVDGQFTLDYINTKSNYWADGLSRGNQGVVDELLAKGYLRIFVSKDRLQQLIDEDI